MNRAITPKRVLSVLVALLVVSSLLPERIAYAISSRPSYFLLSVMGPFTKGLNRLSTAVRGPADLKIDLGDRAAIESRLEELDTFNRKLLHDLEEANRTIA